MMMRQFRQLRTNLDFERAPAQQHNEPDSRSDDDGGEDDAGGTFDLQRNAEGNRDRDGCHQKSQKPAVRYIDHSHCDRDYSEVELALQSRPVLSRETL